MRWEDLKRTPYGSVIGCLRDGREHALDLSSLAMMCGLNRRDVRRSICFIRCNSDPTDPETRIIVSCKRGYYFAATVDEVIEFYNKHRHIAQTNKRAATCARTILERTAGLVPIGETGAERYLQ